MDPDILARTAEPDVNTLIKRSQSIRIQDPEVDPVAQTSSNEPQPERKTSSAATSSSTATTGRERSESKPRQGCWKTLLQHCKPRKNVQAAPTFFQSLKHIILSSYLNILLVFIPVSWAMNFAQPNNHVLVFVTSFMAIIPLASLLAYATEELSMRVGQTLAGLLNATFGNIVELIVAIIALVKCELHIVQSSLVGSIMSNLLLVLGMCFFVGGLKFSEQGFGISAQQLNSSLLTISVIAVLLPAAFHSAVNYTDNNISDQVEAFDILSVSHGVAILLLITYGCYLTFQLFSHKELFNEDHHDAVKSKKYEITPEAEKEREMKRSQRRLYREARREKREADTAAGEHSPLDHIVDSVRDKVSKRIHGDDHEQQLEAADNDAEEEEHHHPEMSLATTLILLVIITVLVAVTAEWLVDSIDGLTASGVISKEFVGVILLPIVGNAAEHFTAVTVAYKDKLTLSLGVAVGSSIQIALFVIPFIVTLGWIIGKPLTLLFDPLESVVLFFTVLAVNYTIQDGKSNWLEGAILFIIYVILAVLFWFYPGGGDPAGIFASCQPAPSSG